MIDFEKLKQEASKQPINGVEIYGQEFLNQCLKESIIDRHTKYPGDQYVLTFDEDNNQYAPVMSLCNISTTIGPAKSKKTFFGTMIASALSARDQYRFGMKCHLNDRKLLYIDTEQGQGHVQKILQRVWDISATDTRMDIYAFRKFYDQQLRLALVENVLTQSKDKYSLVIIDGIVDLMKNYNDLTEAQALTGKLLAWSELFNCHINCVLHIAKTSAAARGHIGTELMNKSETVFRLESDGNSSTVHCHYARNRQFTSFEFMINQAALPCRLNYPQNTEPHATINESQNGTEKELKSLQSEMNFNNQPKEDEEELPF